MISGATSSLGFTAYHSAEYTARHFGRFSPRLGPATPSEVGVHFSAFVAALNLAVIDTVMGYVNVHIDYHLISCYASLYRASGEATLAVDVCQSASRTRRNYGGAAAHHNTHIPASTTSTPTQQHITKTKHAPAAAWRRAEMPLCVPVSKMPVWQAAQATGSVLPAQDSPRRASLRGWRNARPNRRAGEQQLTVSLQPFDTHMQKESHPDMQRPTLMRCHHHHHQTDKYSTKYQHL